MPYAFDKAKILIVDDMKPMLSLTKSILSIFGFKEVFTAENGEQGFEAVCRHDPDLILTDWIMEPLDGLEFTRRIRRDPKTPNPYVPVIMMTGFSSKLRVEQARDIGITEFLVKPFAARDLYLRVAQIIERPRQFVEAEDFFGPDRRRKLNTEGSIPKRREADKQKSAESEKPQEKAMQDILKRLRDEARNISE
jgi:two-component system chemotaxis response regulator CheY